MQHTKDAHNEPSLRRGECRAIKGESNPRAIARWRTRSGDTKGPAGGLPTRILIAYLVALTFAGALLAVSPTDTWATEVCNGIDDDDDLLVDEDLADQVALARVGASLVEIDLTTGGLSWIAGIACSSGGGDNLARNSAGTIAYLTDPCADPPAPNAGGLLSIDLASGAVTLIASGMSAPDGIALNPAETIAYVTDSGTGELLSVVLATGVDNPVASGLASPKGIVLEPGGTTALVTEGTSTSGRLTRVTLATGSTATITEDLVNPRALDVDSSGTTAYLPQLGSGTLVAVDLSSGAVTTVATGLLNPYGVHLDSTDSYALVGSMVPAGRLYEIELSSGNVVNELYPYPSVIETVVYSACDSTICIDYDQDGYGAPGAPGCAGGLDDDCDDTNFHNHPGATEHCDGYDNNCDGETDEPWGIGTACDGVGACGFGVFECVTSSTARCSTDPGGSADESSPEVCGNGIDEDCNGTADDGPCLACSNGVIDGDETDLDCGGPLCPSCPDGSDCLVHSDCSSGYCDAGTCSACTDGDGDGLCVVLDCDDGNGAVWSTPGEVENLVVSVTGTLSWDSCWPGADAVVYDSIRAQDPSSFGAAAVCVESDDGFDTSAMDPSGPPNPGVIFYYLVRGENGCPGSSGEGPVGFQFPGGAPRTARSCP